MNPLQKKQLEKIKHSKMLNNLKQEFLEFGIIFPRDELLNVMPRKKGRDSIIWFDGARNYWNQRNTFHDNYYKYFKKALDNIKSNKKIKL